jgi:hypothetical protein
MRLSGTMPHPKGEISVDLHRAGEKLHGSIVLPEGVGGVLSWERESIYLHGGRQEIEL